MANCTICSAPLPPYADICIYCGSKHDTDFHGIHQYTVHRPLSDRMCPRCNVCLQTINLKSEGKFYIERCEKCMGVFFDSGELHALLEKSVSNVFEINLKRMDAINQKLYKKAETVQYIKCPVCNAFMRRTNFASRSGVIIDQCKDHGIWLDGGELKRLMEWKKSGGEMLHEKLNAGKTDTQRTTTSILGNDVNERISDAMLSKHQKSRHWHSNTDNENFISSITNIVERLFK